MAVICNTNRGSDFNTNRILYRHICIYICVMFGSDTADLLHNGLFVGQLHRGALCGSMF